LNSVSQIEQTKAKLMFRANAQDLGGSLVCTRGLSCVVRRLSNILKIIRIVWLHKWFCIHIIIRSRTEAKNLACKFERQS